MPCRAILVCGAALAILGTGCSGDGTVAAQGSGGAGSGGNPGTGGGAAGGENGSGGKTGTGGTAEGTGGSDGGTGGATGTPGNYPVGNPPVRSAGCGTQGLQSLLSGGQSVAGGLSTSKKLTITSGGTQREYIIDVPSSYDANKPYRLIFGFHWYGGTDVSVATGSVTNGGATNWGFYGLHRMATAANAPAIFVAPKGIDGKWGQQDHAFFDDMLELFAARLCIDTSRVFITGFSFGAMISYSLTTNHQKAIRAAIGIAPANYNVWLPSPILRDPIAWMSTTGMSDPNCPFDGDSSTRRGAKYIALDRAQDAGCTIPAAIPTTTKGSKTHLCYDFQGCKANYPLKVCTFDGGHIAAPADGGTSDNGLTSWVPTESWKFLSQF